MITHDKIDEDLKHSRIREGSMLKRSKFLKEWRKRWIVLTANYLISFTNDKCKEVTDIMDLRTIKSYKSYVSKCEQMIPASFKIRSGDAAMYFCAANIEQKWSWIVSIERMIDLKECGPSQYNNLEMVKEKGFASQKEFQSPNSVGEVALALQKVQIQHAEKQKQNLEMESALLAKEISLEKQELQREKQKLNQIKTLRMSMANEESSINVDFLKEVDKVVVEKNPKKNILESLFEQFKYDTNDFFVIRCNVEYIVNVVSNEKLIGYQTIFNDLAKNHPNRLTFIKAFLEVLSEYEPPILTTDNTQSRTSAQVYSIVQLGKELQTFENWVKFIAFMLESQLKSQINELQLTQIHHKLKSFIMTDESDNTDQISLLLDALANLNQLLKLKKNDYALRLEKIMKNSNNNKIAKKAKDLFEQLS